LVVDALLLLGRFVAYLFILLLVQVSNQIESKAAQQKVKQHHSQNRKAS